MTSSEALNILGLDSNAKASEIKGAYRDLVKVWHPDRFGTDLRLRLKAEEHLKQINLAYQCLQGFSPTPDPSPDKTQRSETPPTYSAPHAVPHAAKHDAVTQTGSTRTLSPRTRYRVALMVAMLADALQLIVFPFFVEGAESPADDVLDCGVAGLMIWLLGWHWEFLPSVLAKLVPGVDLVPFWTLAVANVYRKAKRKAIAEGKNREMPRD